MIRPAGLAVALFVVVAATGAAVAPARAAELGREAPDFTLPDLAGKSVRLGEFRGRKVVVVNFWATWCQPCREELPTLEQLGRERREVLEILAVNVDVVGPAKVRAFARELGLSFRILLDPKQAVGKLYRIRGLPATFIVGREGIVRYRELGYRDWTDRESRFVVEEALRPR